MSPNRYPHISVEKKIIHLMLRYPDAIDEILEGRIGVQIFDPVHQPIVQAIFDEHFDGEFKHLLSRENYAQKLNERGAGGGVVAGLEIYDKCLFKESADPNDLGLLKTQLLDAFVGRNVHVALEKFNEERKQVGYRKAAVNLSVALDTSLGTLSSGNVDFNYLHDMKRGFLNNLLKERENPEEILRCGIQEIDECISVGLQPGHLTLFAADVGGFKSTIMLNVALSFYEKTNKNVLFVTLEMSSDDVLKRILSNRAGVAFSKFANPTLLTDVEVKKIEEAKIWLEKDGKFAILGVNEQTKVSVLRREIERRNTLFKPQLVVIDYVALMEPDRPQARNDLEVASILNSLRLLGRKHGFHVVSACQIGRAALTRLRQEGFDAGRPDSTSLKGAHAYSEYADTVFGIFVPPNEEDKIRIWTIKARHGPKGIVKELRLDMTYMRISSTCDVNYLDNSSNWSDELNQEPEESKKELEIQTIFATPNLDDLEEHFGL